MKFKIKVLDKSGNTFERIEEAPNKESLYEILKEKEETLVSIKEEKEGGFKFSFSYLDRIISTVKTEDKIIFARNLGAMISAGLPVARALSVIKRQTRNKKFKAALEKMEEDIRQGISLHEALEKHKDIFSDLFIAMVRAGEESGSLTESLQVVSDQMEKTHQLKKKIKGALMYPGIILTIMVIIGVLMLIFVVPTMTATFNELGVDLPTTTKMIIFVSDFLQAHTVLFLLIVVATALGLYYSAKSERGERFFNWVFLRAPIIKGLVKETNSARTARTLSSLLSSGVEVVGALEITGDVIQNPYYKKVLKESEKKVQKGVPISEIFSEYENLYPIFVGEMIKVGEETGKLSEMLERVAVYYEESVAETTKNMSTILEPILMVVIGAAVGFFAISMIAPTYSLVEGL